MTHSWESAMTNFVPMFLKLPEQMAVGNYSLWLGIYYWEEGELLTITEHGDFMQHESYQLIRILNFEVK